MSAPKIRLTNEEMRLMALFESITGATPSDCIIDEKGSRVIFLTKPGEMGLAIGKSGKNINSLRRMMGRPVEVVEHAEEAERLIRNSLSPARVKEIRLVDKEGRKMAVVEVDPRDKALAIGRNGRTIEKTRILARRYFDIEHVVIA